MSSIPNRWRLPSSEMLAWPRLRERRAEWARSLWVVGDQAVVSLAGFVTSVIIGRVCGREELGIYALGTTTFWLVAGIPNALAWTPYTSRVPRMAGSRRARYSGSVTIHVALITAAIAAALFLVGVLPASWFGQHNWIRTMCLALVPFTVLMTIREHVRRLCLSQVAVKDLLMLDAPVAAAQVLFLICLAHWGRLTANTAFLAVGAACLFAIVWLVGRRAECEYQPRRAAVHWTYNLQFGRWLLAVSLVWLVADALYRWIVGWQHGLDGLGRFASALAIVLFVNPFVISAVNLSRALSAIRYATGGIGRLRRFAMEATLLMAIAAGVPLLGVAIVGGPLVTLIFGDPFSGLGGVVATLCLGMFVRAIGVPIDACLSALREGRAMLVAMLAQLAVVVVAGVPLVASLGLNGVGYTMALAYGATAAVEWYALIRLADKGRQSLAAVEGLRCAPARFADNSECTL
jgi:O-antigen/teichoic acid export membrane protein